MPALVGLEEIADYISLDKPTAASRFVQRVFDRIEQLSIHPQSGSELSELTGTQYRQLVIPPVRVFYRAQKDVFYIVYVMRGERLFHSDDVLERDKG